MVRTRANPFLRSNGNYSAKNLGRYAVIYNVIRSRITAVDSNATQAAALACELLAPMVPVNKLMSVRASRKRVQACVAHLCRHPEFYIQEFQNLSAAGLLDIIRAHVRPDKTWSMEELAPDQQIPTEVLKQMNVERGENNISFELANTILWYLTGKMKADADTTCIRVVVETLIALAKQGQANDMFLSKVQEGLKSDLNIDLTLEIENIKAIYQTFGRSLDPRSARYLCRYLNSLIPNAALRVSLTLQQAAGSGLSAFILIHQMVVAHPEFRWAAIALLFPAEWTAYQKAIDKVNNNIWFGYSQDKGIAASKNYVSLFYTCAQLAIKVDGLTSWRQYGGGKAGVRHKAKIDALVQAYCKDETEMPDNLTSDVWNASFPEDNGTLDLIRNINLVDTPLTQAEVEQIQADLLQSDPPQEHGVEDVLDTPDQYMN